MKLLLMADAQVGLQITHWLLAHWADDLALVVTTGDNDISRSCRDAAVETRIWTDQDQLLGDLSQHGIRPDWGVMAWWPRIIKEPLISTPREGFINTHPSLLPHNRGKHYSFWSIVEGSPFGVSIHRVETGVDCGDIISQREIAVGWEDTGKSLCEKARAEMIDLFKQTYPRLREGDIQPRPQDLQAGSFHRADEIDPASRIDLDATYTGRELLNRLRARTFPGFPACWFTDAGQTYEARIDIREKTP
jgi:methionyl-tRNA formyltransferase